MIIAISVVSGNVPDETSTAGRVSVDEAVAVAARARFAGSSSITPRTEASARVSACRIRSKRSRASSRGVGPLRRAIDAPMPTASPRTAQVAITRVVPKAT